MREEWIERARSWAEQDPDPQTREQVLQWIQADQQEELRRAFSTPLQFGTAGIRGPVGAGAAFMNAAQILRVSSALAIYLEEQGRADRPVLIGYDGRAESAGFARLAAEVHAGRGQKVLLFPEAGPTPWVAFAVRYLSASAGVVLTPSHNPRGDAGYKLYDHEGIQMAQGMERRLRELLAELPPLATIERSAQGIEAPPVEVLFAYESWLKELGEWVSAVPAPVPGAVPPAQEGLRMGYTALHGVGWESASAVAHHCGVELVPVESQKRPDGNFPTVPFPNPEEPGALDELLALLDAEGLDWGAAHDPDADRLALVCPRLGSAECRPLSGDQLGLLLADALLDVNSFPRPLLISTVVSSPGLEVLAQQRAARVIRTLTGFKWICRPALGDPAFLFAYEEAIGYCLGQGLQQPVLDKDGLAALVAVLSLVQRAERNKEQSPGQYLAGRLAELAQRIGLWVSRGHSLRLAPEQMPAAARAVESLRRAPLQSLGGLTVSSWTDYSVGEDARPEYLGKQDLLVFDLEDQTRICVRPSGTEPKLKFYAHLVGTLQEPEQYAFRERELEEKAERLLQELEEQLRLRMLASGEN